MKKGKEIIKKSLKISWNKYTDSYIVCANITHNVTITCDGKL